MLKKTIYAFAFAAIPTVALAASVNLGSDYFLKGGEKTADDLYLLSSSATLAGTVSGDAVAVGRTITAAGEISADALFVGERIFLGGRVADDARLLGAELQVSGEVADDLFAVGPRIALLPTASVGGNLYAVGDRVALAGQVAGSVRSFARETHVEGAVGGNVETWGSVSFGDGARVGGDLIYHAPREIEIPKEKISGTAVFVPTREGGVPLAGLIGFVSGLFSLQVLMMLAFGFALFLLARERAEEVLLDVEMQFWPRVLRGLIVAVVVPLFAALLLASVVGVPLGIAVAALVVAAFLVAYALAGILVGLWMERTLFARSPYPLNWRPVLLGTLVLALVSVIPYIGLVVYGVLLLAVLGGVGTVAYRHLKAA